MSGMLDLAIEPTSTRSLVRLARFAPHPFARSSDVIPVTGMRLARATPRPLDSASRPRHRGREEDASSQTSAIDLRHEHP